MQDPFPTPPPSVPRLVLFSGIGIGPGLYEAQRSLPARVGAPGWIDPVADESLGTYARRMAEAIPPGTELDPLYLGGVSFGGMIALEAARVLNPRGVFLIGSCYSHRQLSAPVRLVGRLVPTMTPAMVALALLPAPMMLRFVGRPDRRQRAQLVRLVRAPHLEQIIWGGRAIMEWEFQGVPDFPVHQIHGDRDHVVPLAAVRPDAVVPGGGHVINVTHPEAVNAFVASKMGVRHTAAPSDPSWRPARTRRAAHAR